MLLQSSRHDFLHLFQQRYTRKIYFKSFNIRANILQRTRTMSKRNHNMVFGPIITCLSLKSRNNGLWFRDRLPCSPHKSLTLCGAQKGLTPKCCLLKLYNCYIKAFIKKQASTMIAKIHKSVYTATIAARSSRKRWEKWACGGDW